MSPTATLIGGDLARLVRDLEARFIGEVNELRAEVAALRVVLEGRSRDADPADVDLVAAIAKHTEGRRFTCRELLQHARVPTRRQLRRALVAADIVTARGLGKFLERASHWQGGAFRVDRVGAGRDGAIWVVVVIVAERDGARECDTRTLAAR